MLQITQIYQDIQNLQSYLNEEEFDLEQRCLVRFYTSNYSKIEILETIHNIRKLLPNCKIVGATSVSSVIYDSEQYVDSSIIIINTFDDIEFDVKLINWIDKTPTAIVEDLKTLDGNFINLLFSNTSGYLNEIIDDFINLSNLEETPIKLVGGLVGGIDGKSYVFDQRNVYDNGLIAFTLKKKEKPEAIKITFDDAELDSYFEKYKEEEVVVEHEKSSNFFMRASVSIEPISGEHKVTEVNNGRIVQIDDIPVAEWFYNYLDVQLDENLTLDEFKQVINEEYLNSFLLILPTRDYLSRYIIYDIETEELTVFSTVMSVGNKIKIGYVSPKKTLVDSYKLCSEVLSENIESMFVYSCCDRRKILDNIVKLELMPFKENDVSGIFVEGEICNINGINKFNTITLCVSAFGENNEFLSVSTRPLKGYKFTEKESKYFEKTLRKQNLIETKLSLKSEHESHNVQLIDQDFGIPNIAKYELDLPLFNYNKIAVIEIMTADSTVASIGYEGYVSSCKEIFSVINKTITSSDIYECVTTYSLNYKTFIMACTTDIEDSVFVEFIEELCHTFQISTSQRNKVSNVARFAVVLNRKDLLRVGTTLLYNNINSQDSFFVYDGKKDVDGDYNINEEFYIEMIKYAIENQSVIPHYQGIRDNETTSIDRYEALMRIEYQGKTYYPNTFLPIAKKYKLYNMLSEIMIKKALTEFENRSESISLNLSLYDIESNYFRNWILDRLKNYPYPERVVIEFVETEDCSNIELLQNFIDDVHALGSKIAIDDFGSGYSTFTTIVNLKPDYIKIDGSIVSKINTSESNLKILDTICYLAKGMGIKTIAEFVDNAEVQAILEENNVHHSQGFYFSRPSLLDKADEGDLDELKELDTVEEVNDLLELDKIDE